jgi:hypothetical protein
MQAQIEALLIAFMDEKARETQLITSLLAAISKASADRQQLFSQVATAAGAAQPASSPDHTTPGAALANDITTALAALRNASSGKSHH